MSPVTLKSNARMLMAVAMAGLSRLLPGDMIHDRASVSLRRRDYAAEAESQRAADEKRARKCAKRLRDVAAGGWGC